MQKLLALFLAVLVSIAPASAQYWGQGFQPNPPVNFDPNAPFILLPPYTPPQDREPLNQYRLLNPVSPLFLTDHGALGNIDLTLGTVPLSKGGTGATTQQTAVNAILNFASIATGDLTYFNGANWVRLPIGTDNQILTVAAGLPSWSTAAANAPAAGTFITLSDESATLSNSRRLAVSSDLSATDAGAGSTLTLGVSSNVVVVSGSQNITGQKTLTVPRIAYDSGNGMVLMGSTNHATLKWADWSAARNITIPEPGADANVVLTESAQTLNGVKTFGSAPKLSTNTLTTSSGNTITFPNATRTVATLDGTEDLSGKTLISPILSGDITVDKSGGDYTITFENPSGNQVLTIPDSGTNAEIVTTEATQTLNNKQISASSITGTLAIASGGTGATSQQTALNALAPSSPATGDLIYYNGTNWVKFARGTDGQILTSTSSSIGWSSGAGLAPNTPSYLTLATDGGLANERALTAGSGIDFIDDGPGSTLIIELEPTVVRTSGDQTIGGAKTFSTPIAISSGGTGQTTQQAALNALAPSSPSEGDLLYHNGTNWTKLNRGSDGQFLKSTSSSITWGTAAGDMLLGTSQTVTAAKTFQHQTLKLNDSDNSHAITVEANNESANRTLSIPVLGGNDTIVTTGTAQTISGNKDFSGTTTLSGGLNTPLTVANGGTGVTTGARVFGGYAGSSLRALPTSGTLTGAYYHVGNWTSTGTITCNRCFIHVIGTFTLDHALTVNHELPGGSIGSPQTGSSGANGLGLGGGQCSNSSELGAMGGGGGGFGSNGGVGGNATAVDRAGRGGRAYNILHQLCGSGGGGGKSNTTQYSGGGGSGGGGLYIEASGNITINANITADGEGGTPAPATSTAGGGGGSGGGIDIRSLGTVTINSGKTISANGGTGGDAAFASDAAGGGGAGGYVAIHGSTVTNNGTVTVTGGAAGTGSAGTDPGAGATGVTLLESEVWGPRMTP